MTAVRVLVVLAIFAGLVALVWAGLALYSEIEYPGPAEVGWNHQNFR